MNALLTRAELPRILLRLALGALLSIALAWWAGPWLAQAYLPLFKWAYAHVDTDNDLVGLVVSSHGVNHGEDRVYMLTIAPHRYIYVGKKLVATNAQGRGRVARDVLDYASVRWSALGLLQKRQTNSRNGELERAP